MRFALAVLILSLLAFNESCFADGTSNQWNNAWSGQDAASRAVMIQQANSIALRQSDYYSSFGPANATYNATNNSTANIANQSVSSYSTTSVGSMNSMTSTINGNNSSLSTNSATTSSGAMQSTLSH